jgi:hypothetical protein
MVIGDPTKQQSPSSAMALITPLKCWALLRGTHLGQRSYAAQTGRTHDRNRIEHQNFPKTHLASQGPFSNRAFYVNGF